MIVTKGKEIGEFILSHLNGNVTRETVGEDAAA